MTLAPHKIARRGIARTFQDLWLISQVSALENVMLARPNQKGERLHAALLRFGVAAEETRNREEAMHWLKFAGLDIDLAGMKIRGTTLWDDHCRGAVNP